MEGVEITPQMIYRFIQELRNIKVTFIVSPYEADAQLAYLFKSGKVDLVITEDSDLLAYGVEKAFYKMDLEGNGFEVDLTQINNCSIFKSKFNENSEITYDSLLKICILSGCDYL